MIALVVTAFAQDLPQLADVDSQLYRAPMDARSTLWTESSGRMVDGFSGRARVFGQYVHRPFSFVDEFDGSVTDVVSGAAQLSLLGVAEYERFRIGVDVPVYLYSAGLDAGGAGLGDLEVDGRLLFLDRSTDVLGLALSGRLGLPTTTVDLRGLGEDGVRAQLLVHADKDVTEQLYVGSNLGVRFSPRTDLLNIGLDDQLLARVGAGYALSDAAGVSADVNAQVNLSEVQPSGLPVEAMLGGWGRVADDFVVRGGVGRGLTPGIGSPMFRGVLSIAFEPAVGPRDLDGDGIVDSKDACPEEAEDLDGYKDDDGCREPTVVTFRAVDADGAAISGFTWSLPSEKGRGGASDSMFLYGGRYPLLVEAEGYESASVSVDVEDQERQVVEVELQAEQPMGSLRIDVVDEDDEPVELSWRVKGSDTRGTSSSAVDIAAGEYTVVVDVPKGFRALKARVAIERDATVVQKLVLREAKVELTQERIDIKDSVYFETGKAVIKPESFGLLDEVAEIIVDHPELVKIRIEGHTDSRGSAAYNKRLSQSRADSVSTYLQEKGVGSERLEAIGFGEERPLDRRVVPEAWEKNRRVDFFVAERSD